MKINLLQRIFAEAATPIGKWHGIVVSMRACGPEDPGSISHLAKVHNDMIFFLGVFMIQFNSI